MVSNKRNKTPQNSQIKVKVAVSWQHTQEHNPAFKRLMMLLLKPGEDGLVKRKVSNNFQRKTDTETETETYTDTEG